MTHNLWRHKLLRNWFLESVKFDEFSVEINHRRTRSKEEEKTLRSVLGISANQNRLISDQW